MMVLSKEREVTKMENFVSAMLEAIAEDVKVSKDDMIADFTNFSKAIDEKMAEGYSEDEATKMVASSWNFAWWDTQAEG